MEQDTEYYNALDKRSKEYKDWKKSQKSEGLGDIVEKITEATGIKKVVKWLAGDDCGCEDRKEKLNKLWRRQPECLNEEEYIHLKEWFAEPRHRMKPSEQRAMLKIYNRVFNSKQQFTTCSSCLRDIEARMKQVYNVYRED